MILIIIVLGLICAYLINLLADILPQKRRCDFFVCGNCQSSIHAFDIITLKSCPSCGKKIIHVRLGLFILFPVLYTCFWNFPPHNIKFIEVCILLLYFGIVMIIDIEHKLILHPVNLAGFFLSVVIGLNHHSPSTTITGGFTGLLIMLSIYFSGHFYIYIHNKILIPHITESALGFGDVFLGMNIGLLLGFPKIIPIVLLAIITSGLFAGCYLIIMKLIRRYKSHATFPYAPFLILSAMMMIIFF